MAEAPVGRDPQGMNPRGVLIAAGLWSALLAGCTYYTAPPAPAPAPAPSVYDRAWSAALGGAQDVGVQVTSADPASGLIRGTKDGVGVTVLVARQADGGARVQLDTAGPTPRDPDLHSRFLQAYNRRMGR
jgi:hypothetical protein